MTRCFWVHCIYRCDLSCEHTELCYGSRTGDECVFPTGDVRPCRTCAHALTDREREDYGDQCQPCVTSPADGGGSDG